MATIKTIIGTRAELIKTFPVLYFLDSYELYGTGQHDLDKYVEIFNLQDVKYIQKPLKNKSSRFLGNTYKATNFAFSTLFKLKKIINKGDLTLYHGDTMSTTIAAFASKLAGARGTHLEAGLRSKDLFEPFPEEISRIIADKLSTYRIAVSERTYENLVKEGLIKGTLLFGNTIIDSVHYSLKIAKKMGFKPYKGKYAIATIHRHENIKNKKRMEKIIEILENVPYELYVFIHDNTKYKLKQYNLLHKLENIANIEKLTIYPEFLMKLKKAKMALTDGGSIQEESLILKVPAIILRMKTERDEALETGITFLSRLDVEKSKEIINRIVEGKYNKKFENPYGYKGVSKDIANLLNLIA